MKQGYCDPVRLFVKQEPHTRKKLDEGRYRLISSVSLIDQLVERMIFGPQNQLEIQMWRSIPSKPGMGLSISEQAQSIWKDLECRHTQNPACEADISGFDWSVQSWELWADLHMRIQLGNFGDRLRMAATSRFYCFMNSVFQLSNGNLISQGKPGLMKSGSYCTSSTNSRIRCLMARIIEAPWCIAMGDDSVEGYVPDARRRYERLGHTCKDYIPCEVHPDGKLKKVNFCSHELSENKFWLTSWPKTLYRFLSTPSADLSDLESELWGCPNWKKIEGYVTKGNHSDKTSYTAIPDANQETDSSCRDSDKEYTTVSPTVSPAEWEKQLKESEYQQWDENNFHGESSSFSWSDLWFS